MSGVRRAFLVCLLALSGAVLVSSCRSLDYYPEDNEALCHDGYDNDNDGLIDCYDAPCGPWCRICGDGICHPEESVLDCQEDCAVAPVCGNGLCELGETMAGCIDCEPPATCGDSVCDPGESVANCPGDCGNDVCGNGICALDEDSISCPADCGTGVACGDNFCNMGETELTCPIDCSTGPHCGDGFCHELEDAQSCPLDCSFTAFTCIDYCNLQSTCGYIGSGLVWEDMTLCVSDCGTRNPVDCMTCYYSYAGGAQQCDADCDPGMWGCMDECGTSYYCGG